MTITCSVIALKKPNMNVCSKKEKCCVGGSTQGLIYDPEDPCDPGYSLTSSCQCEKCEDDPSYGWVFVQWAATGSCYQAYYGVDPECCGSPVPKSGYGYYATYEEGDSGEYPWRVGVGWDGPGGADEGTWSIGQEVVATFDEDLTWSSDNTPFESPYPARLAACSGDRDGCNPLWWGSCGANFCGAEGKFTSFVFDYGNSDCDCGAVGINISTAAGKKECYEYCNNGGPPAFGYD